MCIGFIISNFPAHSSLKKIILFNRDETLQRPSLPLSQHQDSLFYGLDIPSEGTWLAFSSQGNYAFITNLDDVPFKAVSNPQFRRGKIVKKLLKGNPKLMDQFQISQAILPIVANRSEYNGFNLVVGNLHSDTFGYFSSLDDTPYLYGSQQQQKKQGVKVFSVSNGHALKEKYQKMENGSKLIKEIVDTWLKNPMPQQQTLIEKLEEIMLKFQAPGSHSHPDDSACKDIFIRPYFQDDRRSIFGTVSTSFILVKKESIKAKEITWNYEKNQEIKAILQEMEYLKKELQQAQEKIEQSTKLEQLRNLSLKAMDAFKKPHAGITVQFTLY